MWWLPSLLACAPCGPLETVPVDGGTDVQRGLVAEVLAAFDAATGGDRVCLSGIGFDQDRSRYGGYDLLSNRVTLREDLAEDDVGWVLRHQLCLALDEQEHISTHHAEPYRAAAYYLGIASSDRQERMQAFAAFCSLGPWTAHAIARADCPGDPEDAADLLAPIASEVYIAADLGEATPAAPEVRADLSATVDALDVCPTEDPTTVLIRAQPGSSAPFPTVYRDLRTGGPRGHSVGLEDWAPPDDLPAHQLRTWEGPAGGPRVATLGGGLHHLAPMAERTLVDDGTGWRWLGDGCTAPGTDAFYADGAIWRAVATEGQVGWGPIE